MRVSKSLLGTVLVLGISGAGGIGLPGCVNPAVTGDADVGGAADFNSDVGKKLRAAGATPCPEDKSFLCLPISVPLDHAQPGGKKISVMFAVHPAPNKTRQGVLVTATGGPGYSGIDGLDTWGSTDKRIPKAYDVVYFDLRGVKRSGNLECKRAAATYYAGGLRIGSDAEEGAASDKARRFAADCVAEMGIATADVPFYSTEQAVEDLDAFRQLLGDEKLVLYGLSYGTQLTQTYTARHPDHVARLVIDGVVDLTLGHVDYMKSLNHGITLLLDRTLADCATRPACAAAFDKAPGGTTEETVRAGYAAIAAELAATPVVLDSYRLPSGKSARRVFARNDLDTASFNAVGNPDTRRDFALALGAAYQNHDYAPLQAVAYTAAGIDPETAGEIGSAAADPDMSDAIYYSFTCNDYGLDSPDEATRVGAYLQGGRDLRATDDRLLSPYYGDLPCMFWATTHAAESVAPLRQDGVPVVVVGASGDGATPYDQGIATASRLADGYLITIEGGQHVMYGRGNPCADPLISNFVVDGAAPASRDTQCGGVFVSP